MNKILCFLVMLSISALTYASDLKTKDNVKAFSAEVMKLVGEGRIADGMTKFKPYLIIPESEFNVSLEKMRMQQPMIDQRFGKSISTELIDIEEQGESLMLIVYIQKFEKHVMRWKFYYYKPQDKWILNTYSTDDRITAMFTY